MDLTRDGRQEPSGDGFLHGGSQSQKRHMAVGEDSSSVLTTPYGSGCHVWCVRQYPSPRNAPIIVAQSNISYATPTSPELQHNMDITTESQREIIS